MHALIAFLSLSTVATAQDIYPFKPFPTAEIHARVGRMAEETQPLINIHQVEARGLKQKKPTKQPWAGSYWPLLQGQIANPYHDVNPLDLSSLDIFFKWRTNLDNFRLRERTVLARVDNLSDAELARLAPSEKYDLLTGDKNFGMTRGIWEYVEGYGSRGVWSYTDPLEDMPAGFRFPNSHGKIETWEGICHGWALAATGTSRPERMVNFTLPSGKTLPFYPNDIKALISLQYANSDVQNDVKMEGWRCWDENPRRDRYGRYIDVRPGETARSGQLPACADVHPAVWFLSLVNITGIQGRSMVVEVDADDKVNNHPFAGYKIWWFSPTGEGERTNNLRRAIVPRARYRNDPFAAARNPETVAIVGVEVEMSYVDWARATTKTSDDEGEDRLKRKVMFFDLELDAAGNVVGGQWLVTPIAEQYRQLERQDQRRDHTNQPDFFWVLPKNYARHFVNNPALPNWDHRREALPSSWAQAARREGNDRLIFATNCTVVNEDTRETGSIRCRSRQPRPRPLADLVNKMTELSRR